MPRWRDILTVYTCELRSALRERTIVVNSIIIPLVLYPGMLWVVFTGVDFVQGQTAEQKSRVVIVGLGNVRQDLGQALRQAQRLEIVPAVDNVSVGEQSIQSGTLDALLVLEPAPAAGLPDNVRARVLFDGSRERSDRARTRLLEVMRLYRERRLRDEASAIGVSAGAWAGFALDERNVASGAQMGRFILGLLLPIFFVVMVSVGCFYPAVDSTAGERERGTWETLMATPASRTSIMAGKYLSVTTFGCVAGLLNVAAMSLTLGGILAPIAGEAAGSVRFTIPLLALPVLAFGAVLLSGFVAAGMMVFASFARTFREGQTMIQPFYMAVLVPTMFLGSRGTELTTSLAVLPVINIALVAREALSGVFHLPQIGIAVAASVAAVVGLLGVATTIIEAEDVMVGSYRGSFLTFVRDRLRQGRAR